MSILKKLAVAGLGLAALTGAAQAEDRKFGYTITGTAASDYIFRGISFTNNDPTANLYVEATYGIAYLGIWGSNIDNGGLVGPWEIDTYAGIRPVTGPVSWDLGVLWYNYGSKKTNTIPSTGAEAHSSDIDYVEFKIAATWATPIKNLSIGGTFYYTPDQKYGSTENVSLEANAAYTLPAVGIFTPTISGLYGHSDSGKNSEFPTGYWLGVEEYEYWNAGLKLTVEKFAFDFRYWDTSIADSNASRYLADERFVFTASITLP